MRRKWTEYEECRLRELYEEPEMTASAIAAQLGHSDRSVYTKARTLGLKRPAEANRLAGQRLSRHPNSLATRFKPGLVPYNKGKTMPAEVYEKVKATMFKKGNIPAWHREVYSERVNRDGYVEIKIEEPSKWMLKHRYVWQQEHGPIPAGCNVQFRNGDPTDCRLENLYLISRAEQLRTENSLFARYPKDLQDVIRLRGALNRQIRKQQG